MGGARRVRFGSMLPQSRPLRRYAGPVDAKLMYWTGATLNMAILIGVMLTGIRRARGDRLAEHRRSMLVAVGLVVAFVVSYLLKLLFLGREDLDTWSDAAVWILRFHELCVFTMLISGGLALRRGLALARTRRFIDDEDAPQALPADLRGHGKAGRVAALAACLGLASACAVLASMYSRVLG